MRSTLEHGEDVEASYFGWKRDQLVGLVMEMEMGFWHA
jgi:hypothetical protein